MLTPKQCANIIAESSRIVALTGAGMSTAAGIPDFRGPNGLYVTRRYDPDKVFNIDRFRREPIHFFDFTRDFLSTIESCRPTFTHRFLAELERGGKMTAVITQNIDMLHQQAGSQNVIEIHGGYLQSHCMKTGREYGFEEMKRLIFEMDVPMSDAGGVIKPDIVFFGEPVKRMEDAISRVSDADLLFVLGTSLTIFPAAALPRYANGRVVIVNTGDVNLSPASNAFRVDANLDDYFHAVSDHLNTISSQ